MKKGRLIFAVLAACGLSAAAQAGEWKPAGPWAADYGDESCRLLRGFSDGKDELVLTMERVQPNQFFRIIVIGDGMRTFRGANTVHMQFAPSGRGSEAFMLRSKTADDKQYLDLGLTSVVPMAPMGPPPAGGAPAAGGPPAFKPYDRSEERSAAKNIDSIQFTSGLVSPVTLETGSLDAPMSALQACVSDLVASWGVDAKAHENLKRPVMPAEPASAWIPPNAISFNQMNTFRAGANSFRIMIDASGKPTECVVMKPMLGGDTNEKVCQGIMANGKFTPALDASSQPIASYWIADGMALMPPMGGPGGRR